ncbi:MAG TPA: flagellar protein FliS [Sphingomonas sp.]|nr:flagellar protein FliS [Sphingomonas sp.]
MEQIRLMFGAPSRYAAPGARYRDIDVAARVEGASPHGLVVIMFEELLKSLGTLEAAEMVRDLARRNAAEARVLSLLHGLEAALDHRRGGEIADNLGLIYREARRLIGNAPGIDRANALAQARDMIATISGAWEAIGPTVNSPVTTDIRGS